MKKFQPNKLITLLTLTTTLLTSTIPLNATEDCGDQCCEDDIGCGYAECCAAPCISPTVALGTVAIAAIIAVVVQNRKHHHGHGHSH